MPKEIPKCPKKPSPVLELSRRYEIELITPMFGGGVETRTNDPSFPIRPTAIRGQLQFWWRATIGARYPTPEELRASQSKIWGSTERQSRVRVSVENARISEPVPCVEYRWDKNARRGNGGWKPDWRLKLGDNDQPPARSLPPYALFPFQGKPPRGDSSAKPEQMPDKCILKGSFTLRLEFPDDLRQDVETAVWAWTNFGGIGSRTRRGCGSLYCKDLAPGSVKLLSNWYRPVTEPIDHQQAWPRLTRSALVRGEVGDPIIVWDWLIGMYHYFRQGEGFARNEDRGRSRYPEAETIRRITRRRMKKHESWGNMPDGFPRAEFGLPIVFQFKDEDQGEPRATTLKPFVDGKALERMASPLVLKPLAITKKDAIPVIVYLTTPGVQQVELQGEDVNPPRTAPIQGEEFGQKGSPLFGLTKSGSALEAFLAFARSKGFEEVAR